MLSLFFPLSCPSCLYADQEIEPRTVHRLVKHSSIELHPQAVLSLLYVINLNGIAGPCVALVIFTQLIQNTYIHIYIV